MSRESLIKYAKSITGRSKIEPKKIRYKSTRPVLVDPPEVFVDLGTYSKSKGLDSIILQYKAAIASGDEFLANSIMDQIYFLSFRDAHRGDL